MRIRKHSEVQIGLALRSSEAGADVVDICRRTDITHMTFYRWGKKYYAPGVCEVRELNQFRDESREFKQLVTDLTLDWQILRANLIEDFRTGAHTCTCVAADRRVSGLRSARMPRDARRPPDARVQGAGPTQEALCTRLRELAAAHVDYGDLRLCVLRRREERRVD